MALYGDSALTRALPERLRNAPIVEALCELRFSAPPGSIQEIQIGQMASWPLWADRVLHRVGTIEVPEELLSQQPNLKYQPSLEFRDEHTVGKIGARVVSFHALKPYPGWKLLRPQLVELAESLFRTIPDATIERVGLRYVNLLGEGDHPDIYASDLACDIVVAGVPLTDHFNLNYTRAQKSLEMTVRVATRQFVKTALPSQFTTLVDLDVYTDAGFRAVSAGQVVDWLDIAHDVERAEFFRVLGEPLIERLRED